MDRHRHGVREGVRKRGGPVHLQPAPGPLIILDTIISDPRGSNSALGVLITFPFRLGGSGLFVGWIENMQTFGNIHWNPFCTKSSMAKFGWKSRGNKLHTKILFNCQGMKMQSLMHYENCTMLENTPIHNYLRMWGLLTWGPKWNPM